VLSPNDVSSAHHDAKAMSGQKSDMQLKVKTEAEMEASVAKFVKDVLKEGIGKNIDPGRKRSMIAYVSNALTIYSKAFSKPVLKKGWEVAGHVPFNARRILSKWPGWCRLTATQGDRVINALPEFGAHIHGPAGRCDDDIISAKLEFLPPCTNSVELGGESRDRVVKINAVGYNDARAAAVPEKAAKAVAAAEKAQKKSATWPQTMQKWGPDSMFYPHGAVLIQLRLRQAIDKNLHFKPTEKVDLLRQKWREFDAVADAAAAAGAAAAAAAAAPALPQ
jgi:hypothetical protein